MNIAIDIRTLMQPIRTGVGEYCYELINSLAKHDQKNNYYLFYNAREDVSDNIPQPGGNINLCGTNYPNKLFNLGQFLLSFPKIDKLVGKKTNQKIDLFLSPNLNFTSLSKNSKHILIIHDLSYVFYPHFYNIKQRLWHKAVRPKKQCQVADIIVVPSHNTKRDVCYYYNINPKKITVINPGLSSDFQKSLDNIQNNEDIEKKYSLPDKYLLFLGATEPRKNIISLIQAFEIFAKKINKMQIEKNNYFLVIAGAKGWKNKSIYNYAQKSNFKQYIKFVGYIDPEDKPYIYKRSKLFIFPSIYEGFGFPILEAMAAGTPVITSNRSSLPEVANNCALLINPNITSQIASVMEKIINDEQLRQQLLAKGKQNVLKYNWQQQANKFINLFDSLC